VPRPKRHKHRLDRLSDLRYHHKLILSILIVSGILALIVLLAKDKETLKIVSEYGADDARFPDYLSALAGAQLTSGNTFELLQNGDAFFPRMLDDITRARTRVDFETYIYEKGQVAERFTNALEAAARRGVEVNLVVDAVGSKKMPMSEWNRLRNAGAHVADYGTPTWYKLQQLNYRTHRKVLTVDGRVAFVGGAGVADQWAGNADAPSHWRDLMVRLEGPLVRELEGAFNDNFVRALGAPAEPIVSPVSTTGTSGDDRSFVVRSSATGGSNDLKRTYMIAIASARRTLDICSPYFLLDRSSRWALDEAVKRGVRIRVLVEGDQTDARIVKFASRAAYARMMSEGITVAEYQPTMLHEKVMIVDGAWSMFGSANFDNRSFELNDEMNVAVASRPLAQELTRAFDRDLQSARQLSPETWSRRPVLEKIRDHFWAFFGEMF
jgi:cardiolipin synthase